MRVRKNKAPDTTELIDWLNDEGIVELDWDFPEDGDLIAAGLDSEAIAQLASAVEDYFGMELTPEELAPENLGTPLKLAALIESRLKSA